MRDAPGARVTGGLGAGHDIAITEHDNATSAEAVARQIIRLAARRLQAPLGRLYAANAVVARPLIDGKIGTLLARAGGLHGLIAACQRLFAAASRRAQHPKPPRATCATVVVRSRAGRA